MIDDIVKLLKTAVESVEEASKKLEKLKADLIENPEVDTSATDATQRAYETKTMDAHVNPDFDMDDIK